MTDFNNKKEIVMKVLREFSLDSSAVWNCHGTPVILHKALEQVAEKANISFEPPQIIEANAEKKIAVICVTGRKGERSEWSFGEAMPSNNKNSYPFAMAEKRAKDRVILKLIGLSGDAYSEDEAGDFKESKPAKSKRDSREDFTEIQTRLTDTHSLEDLKKAWEVSKAQISSLPDDWKREIEKIKDVEKQRLTDAKAKVA